MGSPVRVGPRRSLWPAGMPDPLAVALGFRESGECFPGWEQYGPSSLDIGLSVSLSIGRLRDMLGKIRSAYPKLGLRFVEAECSALTAAVREGGLSLAFVLGEANAPDCDVETLWSEQLLVALYEHHPLCRDNAISREALRHEQFLLPGDGREGNAAVALLERALEGRPRSLVHTDVQRETLMNMVGMGFGLALAPVSSLGAYYPGVVYKPFEGAPPYAPVRCVRRKEAMTPELEAILDAARPSGRVGIVR